MNHYTMFIMAYLCEFTLLGACPTNSVRKTLKVLLIGYRRPLTPKGGLVFNFKTDRKYEQLELTMKFEGVLKPL